MRRTSTPRLWRHCLALGMGLICVLGSASGGAQGAASADAPSVVVLPFRVHSADPAAELGDSLAALLRSRLEAAGRVRVLDAGDQGADVEASPTAIVDL